MAITNSRGLAQIALLRAVSKWVNHYERNDKRKDRASKEEEEDERKLKQSTHWIRIVLTRYPLSFKFNWSKKVEQ